MCQAIRDGGRRCPIHRRDVLAALYVARNRYDLPKDVVEDLFNELRREGRHLSVAGVSGSNYDRVVEDMETALREWEEVAPDDSRLRRYREILADRSSDDAPDGATLYALRRLQGAARSRASAISNEIAQIADENNMAMEQAARRWAELRNAVDTSRSAPVPSEYTAEAQRRAFDADLPSDRASIVAFSQLRQERVVEQEPRITRESFAHRSSAIVEAGYDPDGGRLEIVLNSNPDTVYAWHSVPEEVWNSLQTADRPMSVFSRMVRGVPEYMYSSAEEAQADAYRSRCSDCGQFAASGHTCPVRDGVAEPEAATPQAAVPEETVAESASNTAEPAENEPAETSRSEDAETPAELDVEESAEGSEATETPASTAPTVADFVPVDPPARHYNLPEEALPREIALREELLDFMKMVDENGRLVPGTAVGPLAAPIPVEGGEPRDPQQVLVRQPEQVFSMRVSSSWSERPQVLLRRHLGGSAAIRNTPANWDEIPDHHQIIVLRKRSIFYFMADAGPISDGFDVDVRNNYTDVGWRASLTITRGGYSPEWEQDRLPTEAELAARVDCPQNSTSTNAYSPRRVYFQSEVDYIREFDHRYARGRRGRSPRDSVQWIGVRDLRRVLNEGGIAAGLVKWDISSDYRSAGNPPGFVDESGMWVPTPANSDTGYVVSGTLAVKKNDDGTVAVASRRGELRCSCPVYRRNYDCAHVRYVHTHGSRLATNMLTPRTSNRGTAGPSDGPFASTYTSRADFSVVDVRGEADENGEAEVVEQLGVFTRGRGSRWRQNRVTDLIPDEILEDPSLTDEERIHMADVVASTSRVWSGVRLPSANIIRGAVRNAPVEVRLNGGRGGGLDFYDSLDPSGVQRFGATSYYNRMAARTRRGGQARIDVQGAIRLERADDGSIRALPGRNFRCTCGRFVSEDAVGNPCVHTRVALAMMENYIARRGQDSPEYAGTAETAAMQIVEQPENVDYIRRARAAMIIATDDPTFDPNTPEGEEQVNNFIAREEDEARLRAEEERLAQERREREVRERAEREMEEYTRRAAEQRAQVESQRERFLASHPDFARDREAYLASRKEAWQTVEPGYSEDLDALKADIAAAQDAKAHRRPAIPAKAGDVTDGICDPNIPGSRRFGIEIEFDIPNGGYDRVRQAIIDDMRAEGLTSQTRMRGYHGSANNGWSEWSLENDCTVGGELVSPLLADTPEHWEQLGKVLDIIRRHGGRPSVNAGAHVNVSTSSFLGSMAKHAELLRVMKENEDVLYRTAADPSRGTHRGGHYCTPNVDTPRIEVHKSDPAGLISGLSTHAHGHGRMVNIQHSARTDTGARAEFRLWDSSLDLATIQQQVAVSVALADYAERQVEEREASPAPERAPVPRGTYAAQGSSSEVPDEALRQVATLADKIFRRQEDRKNFVSLFAINRWSSR